MAIRERTPEHARKKTFGIGLLKGMRVTIKHLFKHNTVIEYPDVRQDLPARTRGVIALKEENCTVCMLCARECPDWCIYIDSHKETLPPKRAGGRPRKRNVLDRFAIDYSLCMYCGICVEVCPYDALFWSREYEYAELDIRELTHEKERLSDWMASVVPPPPLETGAELPGQAAATAAGAAGPGSAQRPAPPAAETAAAERPEQAAAAPAPAATAAPAPQAASEAQRQAGETAADPSAPKTEGRKDAATSEAGPSAAATSTETDTDEAAPKEEVAGTAEQTDEAAAPTPSASEVAKYQEMPGPNVDVPSEDPRPVALEPTEDPDEVYQQVLKEQRTKGSSPQVAEARAKVARVKAERGIKRGPTPVPVGEPVPSAPPKGHAPEPVPGGAPRSEDIAPQAGPVEPATSEAKLAPKAPRKTTKAKAPAKRTAKKAPPAAAQPEPAATAEPVTPEPADGGAESPDAVYERVLAAERAKGSSDTVATARAKAARTRAEKARGS
ncbi:MAG: 4Fe-4S binding protein [Actinomycetota bacterium]|nr:4Fe-4S binding protein [Actinomycetota bacterium]